MPEATPALFLKHNLGNETTIAFFILILLFEH